MRISQLKLIEKGSRKNKKFISMKITTLVAASCFIVFNAIFCYGQCYSVIKVKGKILLEKTNDLLKVNDIICENDKLVFSSEDPVVVVHSTEKGRLIIRQQEKDQKEKGLSNYVKNLLSEGTNRLGSRGFINLDKEFGEMFFLISPCFLPLDSLIFPMDSNKFFYIKYTYNGKVSNIPLRHSQDTLIFDKETVMDNNYKLCDSEFDTPVSLYYYDKQNKMSNLIAKFRMIIADETELLKDLKYYYKVIYESNRTDSEYIDDLLYYISDLNGNVYVDNVLLWLKANFSKIR